MKIGDVLIGVVAGAAAGAIIGVLMAPNSGHDSRMKIIKNSTNAVDVIKSKFVEAISMFNSSIEAAKEAATEMRDMGKAKVAQVKSDNLPATQ